MKSPSKRDARFWDAQARRSKYRSEKSEATRIRKALQLLQDANMLPRKAVCRRPRDTFLDSFDWRKLRMETLKKHGARCQACGATPKTGTYLCVDHILPRKTHPQLALEPTNLQVLCNACNHGKGNWDNTDWRPT